jgi:hypothetical protein
VDLLHKLRIVLCKLKNAGADFLNKHLNASLSDGIAVSFRDLPGCLEHADEVFIIRDAHREICVVIKELLVSDLAITVTLSTFKVL